MTQGLEELSSLKESTEPPVIGFLSLQENVLATPTRVMIFFQT